MEKEVIIKILRSIQTAEDFIEKKDDLLDNVEKFMNANLEILKKLQSSNLPKAELQQELFKFQQQWEAMGSEIEPEFVRLDTIPGVEEHGEELEKEFFKRMEPIAMEGQKIMAILSGVEPNEISSSAPPSSSPRKVIERQKLDEFETLYGIKSIEELMNSKDQIIDLLGEKLKDNVQKLRSFKNRPQEEYMPEFKEISHFLEVFDNEGQIELERLRTLPGGVEYIPKFQEEMVSRLGTLLDEMDQLLEELK